MEKILKQYWMLKIGNYLVEEYEMDMDAVLDLDIRPLDKSTCIVINKEIGTISIWDEKPNGKVDYKEMACEDDQVGSVELYQRILIGEGK
jgi:hypothetical protein